MKYFIVLLILGIFFCFSFKYKSIKENLPDKKCDPNKPKSYGKKTNKECQKDIKKTVKKSINKFKKELVKKQALLAKACGCHGIICAGSDLKFVKEIFKGEIITPGIRLKGDSAGDQKRVMGPRGAFKNGSTALVMGRSIIKNKKIKKNIQRLIKELK